MAAVDFVRRFTPVAAHLRTPLANILGLSARETGYGTGRFFASNALFNMETSVGKTGEQHARGLHRRNLAPSRGQAAGMLMERGEPLFAPLAAWASLCSADVTRFLPTSDVIAVLSALPSKEGYKVGRGGVYLDEMRKPDGREPYAGYTSFGLYVGGHLARFYAVRIATGDIVDPVNCKLYRSAAAMTFRRRVSRDFATKPVSSAYLANEVGCDHLAWTVD